MNPPHTALPASSQFSCLYQGLYHIRRLGNCFGRIEQVASGATTFGTFLGGFLLSCVAGQNTALRLSSRMIMIATKAVATVKVQIAFAKCCGRLTEELTATPDTPPPQYVSCNNFSLIPVGMQRRMAHTLNRVIAMIIDICWELCSLVYYMVLASSHLLDLADAIKGNEEIVDQSVKELLINCTLLSQDCPQLVKELCEYEIPLHNTLRFLGAGHETELISVNVLRGCQTGAYICYCIFTAIGTALAFMCGFKIGPPATSHEELIFIPPPKDSI